MSFLKWNHVFILACCVSSSWVWKTVDSFWFTDTNFQPAQAKVLPMIKSITERPGMSFETPLKDVQKLTQVESSLPTVSDMNNKCFCSPEWFERQLDLSIRKQFTEYFVKIADEELKKEVRAKNLSQELFGPYRDLIPLFDRLLLLNRIRNDATILSGGGRVSLLSPNNELEEIWINFRPSEAIGAQQQLQPLKSSNHVASARAGKQQNSIEGPVITRVKDREALFDLKSRVMDNLVLVESEQLLVVNTGLGWRPLQMQPALRDLRRNIAIYGIQSNEDRRRLLESSAPKTPPAVDYLAKARESDAIMSNYYHDRSSTIDATDEADEDDGLDNDDDQDDEDEEEGEEESDEESEQYLTGYSSLLDSGSKRLKAKPKESPAAPTVVSSTTIAPEIRRHSAAVVPSKPGNVQSAVELTQTRQPATSQTHRNNQSPIGSRQLRIAALNEPFTGGIHGIRGADFECSKAARKAAIKGSFKAFLASGYQNLNELLRHNVRQLPIVNLRNEELATSWNDLFSKPTKFINPLSRIYSFDGRLVAADSNWPNKLVWNGVGSSSGQRHHLHQCDGWHSNSKAKYGMATPLHSLKVNQGGHASNLKRNLPAKRFSFTGLFKHQSNQTSPRHPIRLSALDGFDKYPCSMPLIVLCIETVGQTRDSSTGNYLDNYFDMDPRNMS